MIYQVSVTFAALALGFELATILSAPLPISAADG
jgi:hypothetical protein